MWRDYPQEYKRLAYLERRVVQLEEREQETTSMWSLSPSFASFERREDALMHMSNIFWSGDWVTQIHMVQSQNPGLAQRFKEMFHNTQSYRRVKREAAQSPQHKCTKRLELFEHQIDI
jgi:hypothetical protein